MKQFYGQTKKILLMALGFVSLATGIIGIFVPLLPTTVFILIAAWAFMNSSERFHHWILNHPRFGPMIINWRRTGAIPLSAKMLATVMVGFSVLSIVFFVHFFWLQVGVIFGLGCVLLFIWTRPNS